VSEQSTFSPDAEVKTEVARPEAAKPGTPSWYRRTKILTAGILKIGAMVTGGKGPRPEKLDHFRYCSASTNKDGVYPDHPDFAKENGEKLDAIKVEFYSDDETLNVEFGWQLMKGGATVCRGLGNGDMEPERRPELNPAKPFEKIACACGESCMYGKNGSCKRVSVARLMVPGRNSRGLLHTPLNSVWQFRSHGDNTAQLLQNAMRDFKALTGGILAGIPLMLTMQRETRRGVSAFYSVGLTFDGLPDELEDIVQRIHLRREKNRAIQAVRAVKSATVEDLLRGQGRTIGFEDAKESFAINAEFSPSTLNGAKVETPAAGVAVPVPEVVDGAAEAQVVATETMPAGTSQDVTVEPEAAAVADQEIVNDQKTEPAEVPTPAPAPVVVLPERKAGEKDLTMPQANYIRTLAEKAGVEKGLVEAFIKNLGIDQGKALLTFLLKSPDQVAQVFAA